MSAPFNSRRGGGGAGKGGGTRLRPGIIRISDEGKKKEYINGNRSSCTRLTLFDSLGEVLTDLYKRYPALKEQIQPEEGLSGFVNVYINDQDVRYLQGLETHVGPADTIQLLPAMAGGQKRD